MDADEFDWRSGRVVAWDLAAIDRRRPLALQAALLKEDLAQVEHPGGTVIDVGWYPEFQEDGAFLVLVVAGGEWERPLARRRCATIDELARALANAVALAERAQHR